MYPWGLSVHSGESPLSQDYNLSRSGSPTKQKKSANPQKSKNHLQSATQLVAPGIAEDSDTPEPTWPWYGSRRPWSFLLPRPKPPLPLRRSGFSAGTTPVYHRIPEARRRLWGAWWAPGLITIGCWRLRIAAYEPRVYAIPPALALSFRFWGGQRMQSSLHAVRSFVTHVSSLSSQTCFQKELIAKTQNRQDRISPKPLTFNPLLPQKHILPPRHIEHPKCCKASFHGLSHVLDQPRVSLHEVLPRCRVGC